MRDHGLFQPDVLIAELAGASRRHAGTLSSEKRLMLAVLQDAFECYQKHVLADDRLGRELFQEAAAWIESTSTAGLFSFESISEALDLEPKYLRRGLAEWHQRQLRAQCPAPIRAVVTPPRAARGTAMASGRSSRG